MVTFEQACAIALEQFRAKNKETNLYSAFENERGWIFYGKSSNEVEIGGVGLFVYADGTTEPFYMPKDRKILRNSTPIELPEMD